MHIVIQSIPFQKSSADTQQGSDQHQTTASNDDSEQQSSVQQPAPQYALLNYKPKDQGVSIVTYCIAGIFQGLRISKFESLSLTKIFRDLFSMLCICTCLYYNAYVHSI